MSTERILIDGYHLLHAALGSADIGPSLERARTRFLDNLAAVPSRVRAKFEVVFDAMQAQNPIGERMRHHGIAVFFARDRSADDYIGREVSRVAAKRTSAWSITCASATGTPIAPTQTNCSSPPRVSSRCASPTSRARPSALST